MITSPMLAADANKVLNRLNWPLLATPKLDGIRTLKIDGKAVGRSFDRVPNLYSRRLIEDTCPDNIDTEWYIPDTEFHIISGAWRRGDGRPQFRLAVFDYVPRTQMPYWERMVLLQGITLPEWCDRIVPVEVKSLEELLLVEEKCLEAGYEGVMLRTVNSPYKCGRSTVNEQYLLKLKRFVDAEARIIGFEELQHNDNAAEEDNFGRTKRSTHAANLRAGGMLGALVCEFIGEPFDGVVFNVGTGYTSAQRQDYWQRREELLGQIVKFRYQAIGSKVKPRIPKFHGFRAPEDMS